MANGVSDRPCPAEAKVAVSRQHGPAGDGQSALVGTVHIQLHVAETEGEAVADRNGLGAEHLDIEPARGFPVGDMDHAVIEMRRDRHQSASVAMPSSRAVRASSAVTI